MNTREQIYNSLRRQFDFLQEVLQRAGRPDILVELDGVLWRLAQDISDLQANNSGLPLHR